MNGASSRGVCEIPRRFHAYNVGLLKTGTTSITHIFGAYRSAHEFMGRETYAVLDRSVRAGSDDALRRFLRDRDARGALDMDSAEVHQHYIRVLVEEFPDAKFILTIRDCYSWLDSLVNYLLNADRSGGEFTGWGREQLGLPFDLPYRDEVSRNALRPLLESLLPAFLDFWRDGTCAVLDAVPAARLLIVRTHEISQKLHEMAAFLGIPATSLDRARSHALKAEQKHSLALMFDPERLAAIFACAEGPPMTELFPEFTFARFVAAARTDVA